MIDRQLVTLAVVLLAALIAIVVIAGAVVTIVNPKDEPFHDYVTDLTVLASAVAAAIGAFLFKNRNGSPKPKGNEQ